MSWWFIYVLKQIQNAIFSGLTALELLHQTDQIAKYVNITVTRGYKINTNGETKFRINYVDKKILNIGVIEVKSSVGNIVKCYCFERVLCDFIARQDKIEIGIFVNTIWSYADWEHKDYAKLFEIAEQLGVLEKVAKVMRLIRK